MKKILLSSLFIVAAILMPKAHFAQCTPDSTLQYQGIIAPPAGSQVLQVNGEEVIILPKASVGSSYDEVLYFKIPTDTTVGTFNATIDYVKYIDIPNLPAGLSVSCNNADCKFLGGSYGCIRMNGTSNTADSLQILVAFELKITAGSGIPITTQDTLRNIYLVTTGNIGNEENLVSKLNSRFYPNPANSVGHISFNAVDSEAEVNITNIIGNTVFHKIFPTESGENKISLNLEKLPKGMYLYSVKNGEQTHSGRFIIAK